MEYIVHLPHSRRRQLLLLLRMPGVQLVARRGRPNDERAPRRRTPLHQIVSRLLFGHEKSVFSVLFIIAFKMFDTCHVS